MGRHKVEYWEISCDWDGGKCSARVNDLTYEGAERAWKTGGGVILDLTNPARRRYYCPTDNPENR